MDENVPLRETFIPSSDSDPMWGNRAKAIQSYANLEQALCRLFALLLECPLDAAAIVFFKITSAQARRDIIEKLFRRRFRNEFSLFRNSLLKNLKPIDNRRNEIVHWNAVCELRMDEKGIRKAHLSLRPPTFWLNPSSSDCIEDVDLSKFYDECRFYTGVVGMFDAITRNNQGPMSADELRTWHEIFQQALVYPPLAGTPLSTIQRV